MPPLFTCVSRSMGYYPVLTPSRYVMSPQLPSLAPSPPPVSTPASYRNDVGASGIVHDDDEEMTPRSPASTDAMSVLGGGLSSLGDPEAGGAAAAIATARGGAPSDGSGEEDSAGWGKKWAAHRRKMLREFDGAGGSSGADKVRGRRPYLYLARSGPTHS